MKRKPVACSPVFLLRDARWFRALRSGLAIRRYEFISRRGRDEQTSGRPSLSSERLR